MSIKDFLEEARKKNEAEQTAEAIEQAAQEAAVIETEEKEHNALYWIFHNTGKSMKGFFKRNKLLSIVLLLVLALALFLMRSSIQPGVVFLRRYFLLFVIFAVITYFLLRNWPRKTVAQKFGRAGVILGLFAVLYFFGRPVYEYVGLSIHYNKIEKVELNELPETFNERIQPLNAIRTLTNQELLSETESATDPKFIRRKDGSYSFSMALGPSPKYKVQQVSKDMEKVIAVSATSPAPDFSAGSQHDAHFDIGEFLVFSRRTDIAAVKSLNFLQYWNYEPADVRFIEDDNGNWVQVVSLVKWKGLFIPRPVFGGVIVIEQNDIEDFATVSKRVLFGRGKFISADDIEDHEFLRGQNIIPIKVSEWIAKSFRFQEGFFAPMPGYHEGDIRIPKLKSDQNAMPFIAFFQFNKVNSGEDKLYNYFGLEPYEETKLGLNTSLFIPSDGVGPNYYMDHSERQDAYIGSSAVYSKIIESRKNYDWNINHPAEFRPFIRNIGGKPRFFWLSTVVTKSNEEGSQFIGGTIPEVTLTDARYSQVVWVSRDNLPNTRMWPVQIEEELKDYWADYIPSTEIEIIEDGPAESTIDAEEPTENNIVVVDSLTTIELTDSLSQ